LAGNPGSRFVVNTRDAPASHRRSDIYGARSFWEIPLTAREKIKKVLAPDAEEVAAEVVFDINLAPRTEAADQFHARGRRLAAGAEEFGRLVFFKRVLPVILAVLAVFPADCPVLFGVLYNRFVAGVKHERRGERSRVIDLFNRVFGPSMSLDFPLSEKRVSPAKGSRVRPVTSRTP
jgi:hypothetical protein